MYVNAETVDFYQKITQNNNYFQHVLHYNKDGNTLASI